MRVGIKALRAIAMATPLSAAAYFAPMQTSFAQQAAGLTAPGPVLVTKSYDSYDKSISHLYMTKADFEFARDAYSKVSKGRESPDEFTAYIWSELSFPDGSADGGGDRGNFARSMDRLARAASSFPPRGAPYRDLIATYVPIDEARSIPLDEKSPASRYLQMNCRIVLPMGANHYMWCYSPHYQTRDPS